MGKGSSVLMLSSIRESLDSHFEKLSPRMSIKWYTLNDAYYVAHVKIPSRKHDKLFYDVLLQFDKESIEDNDIVINHANMSVFSNCPSFTYTYAFVYREKGQLIEWSRSKYNKNILSKRPESRNPNEILSYERSLYLACKYISTSHRNYISKIKTLSVTATSYASILSTVASNDMIENLYKEYDSKISGKKDSTSKEKTSTVKKAITPSQKKESTNKKGVVSKTKKTSKSKTTNKAAIQKKVKSTKKV
jgi:hypothetical protein